MRRTLLALSAALAWLLAAPALAVTTPEPAPSTNLTAWIANEAPQVVAASETSSLTPEERATVDFADPLPVWSWDPAFAEGRPGADPLAPTSQWVSALSLDGAGLGVLVVSADETLTVTDHREIWDPQLAAALLAVPAASLVYDEDLDAWVRVAGEILTPITNKAKDTLAGSLPVDEYQPYLRDRLHPAPAPVTVEEAEPQGMATPVIIAAAVVTGLLALTLTTVWVRRPLPEETP